MIYFGRLAAWYRPGWCSFAYRSALNHFDRLRAFDRLLIGNTGQADAHLHVIPSATQIRQTKELEDSNVAFARLKLICIRFRVGFSPIRFDPGRIINKANELRRIGNVAAALVTLICIPFLPIWKWLNQGGNMQIWLTLDMTSFRCLFNRDDE